ncbi:MAG: 16S rRNA (guanine(527)-N(7))-methyltransferase RsmG [Desulfosarcinaceae bacterium]
MTTKPKTRPGANKPRPGAASLSALFDRCGISLSLDQAGQMWRYHEMLRRHNAELNLTRLYNFENMVIKLYVDAALPALLTDLPSPLMDLGSGPGMPGIPLKILRPELEIHLAEGRAKRADFLRQTIAELGLTDIQVVQKKIGPDFEADMAGIITRAVETMDQTLNRVQACLRREGRLIFMKGPGCDAEIQTAGERFKDRFELVQDLDYRIGNTQNQRRLVVFRRLDAPPQQQARRAARRHAVQAVASSGNPRFKALKKLLESRGVKKASQALLSGHRPVQEMLARFPDRCLVWITSGAKPVPPENSPAAMAWLQLSGPLFDELDIFGTRSPLLCIQVPPITPWSPDQGFAPGCNLLIPFQDPENIGAAIRSAAAFGAAQVILLAESAHPYHPKALRASGGSVPGVILRSGPSLGDLPEDLPLLALSAEGRPITGAGFPEAFGLLAGLEGRGLPAPWRAKALRIPIDPRVESLNAAAAVAVALYEWRRRDQTGK